MDKCDKCVNFGEPQLRFQVQQIGTFSLSGVQRKFSAFDYQVVICKDCGTEHKIVEITREDGKKIKSEPAELSIRIDVGNIEE